LHKLKNKLGQTGPKSTGRKNTKMIAEYPFSNNISYIKIELGVLKKDYKRLQKDNT
jgi:hypothetical protein